MSNNLPSTRRIGDLISDVTDERLIVRPLFQRRQVWNNADKERFIDTILKGYPFPEIFIAEGKREGKGTRREKLLVDGQQRLSTAITYHQGSDELLYRTVPRFEVLSENEKTAFLDYVVAVRDLGTASSDVIREIFNRINSTDYALKSMEILNAMYSGAYKQFCEQLSRDPFFERHKVFPEAYKRRMLDVNFSVILVTTLLSGYYKRDERNKEYLERYNEEFTQVDVIRVNLDRVFDFVERCSFEARSRAWKQTNLFTLLVELHTALVVEKLELDPVAIGQRLKGFFAQVDGLYVSKKLPEESAVPQDLQTVFAYLKAATKATNDKYTRVERARIISELIHQAPPQPAAQPAPASVGPPMSPSRRTRKKST
jgi:Protein of unknown function DUF262